MILAIICEQMSSFEVYFMTMTSRRLF